jgi:hypothetical protein
MTRRLAFFEAGPLRLRLMFMPDHLIFGLSGAYRTRGLWIYLGLFSLAIHWGGS